MLPMFLSSLLPLWRSTIMTAVSQPLVCVCQCVRVCLSSFACRWCDMHCMSLPLYADIHAWMCVRGWYCNKADKSAPIPDGWVGHLLFIMSVSVIQWTCQLCNLIRGPRKHHNLFVLLCLFPECWRASQVTLWLNFLFLSAAFIIIIMKFGTDILGVQRMLLCLLRRWIWWTLYLLSSPLLSS